METQGLVAPEAMAMNKLVIFSECGPGPETVEDKVTGLLCNPYDPIDIAKQINWTLDNKEESRKIAQKGRAFVLSNFEINKITQDNIDFYNSIRTS
jgi:glycosyltransferase involved in cell wall biosynthesis